MGAEKFILFEKTARIGCNKTLEDAIINKKKEENMRKIIKFCLDNNILVFDGVADSYNSLTKRLLYLSKKEYKKHFEGEPTFYFESGVSSERMNEIGISDYNTVDQKDSNWFFENDDYCKNRDEHMFVLSDGENGIIGCYS